MRRAAVIVVLACTQSTVAPPANIYASGTRLRANVIDAGGGATLFQGWHDTPFIHSKPTSRNAGFEGGHLARI